MAGYSGTPLAKKLGIKPGTRLALDQAPPGWAVPELPDGVVVAAADGEPVDLVLALFREAADPPAGGDRLAPLGPFSRGGAERPERLPALARRIFPAGSLWLAWPRKAGGH